jgi:hypothetical protein
MTVRRISINRVSRLILRRRLIFSVRDIRLAYRGSLKATVKIMVMEFERMVMMRRSRASCSVRQS